MTLSFWYLFQEALWNTDFGFDVAEDGDAGNEAEERERDMMPVARAVYTELVAVLRRKVMWPPKAGLDGWARGQYLALIYGDCDRTESPTETDQRDKFQAYRRDVGDTLINAYVCTRELFAADNTYRNPRYYILKDDMLAYYVNDILQRLSARQEHDGWEVRSCLCWSYAWS